jgi:hypothetical protein
MFIAMLVPFQSLTGSFFSDNSMKHSTEETFTNKE